VTKLSIVQPIILGLIMARGDLLVHRPLSCQAVVTGAYRGVLYQKNT